ncbi:AraC family transcriptional regulator [Burkholderia sp. Bp9143]|uniref:AraC family transcriptional regulator n=1 Tax=Burkholderia sp. Bp9143 TaxID=2184574 RepID=UPI000F5A03D1|nr:AraC family transcriptional regulator [Burkholderia sp. Bp9143]RQR34989.1 AraC family transcriptional regulator [Burkholderia sp. Bp9143]
MSSSTMRLNPTQAGPGAGLPSSPVDLATLSEKRASPSKLAALMEVAAHLELDTSAVLTGTDLDPNDVSNPFTLTSAQQFLTAVRNALRYYPGSDLGVRVGRLLHASSYGMYGYATLCAETLGEAFDAAVRFHRLANGLLGIRWGMEDDLASWHFPAREDVALPELDARLYAFLLDMQFVLHATFVKDVMGSWCVPVRARFACRQPAHAALLAEALDCPVAFDQECHALSYPAAWLSRAPQLAHPITAAQVSRHCAQLLDELQDRSGITLRVYDELTRIPGRFPDIDAIAGTLHMTSRTLRRKLDAAGTSYNELLTGVRRALAIDYLGTTALSTEDIASVLGFSDAASFRHAFKRWTGTTPNEVRGNADPAPRPWSTTG